MNGWKLELRQAPSHPIDAAPIRTELWRGLSQLEIERLPLGGVTLGEWFRVERLPTPARGEGTPDRIVVVGDLSQFHGVAAQHRYGEFIVEGSVGNGLGGPCGASHVGMRGGLVHVHGDAGDYVGHRMRRGMLVVEGRVGDLPASQMIAGTVVVGGTVGAHPAYCMRRGTLLVAEELDLCPERYSAAIPNFTAFSRLLARSLRDCVGSGAAVAELAKRLESSGFLARRGDFAVAGQGEIIVPAAR